MNLLRRITLRNGIIAGAFLIVGAAAATGWMRKTTPSASVPVSYNTGSQPQPSAPQPANNPPAVNNPPDNSANNPPNNPSSYTPSGYTEQRDSYGRPIVTTPPITFMA
jgi:hypothetical protein